MFEKLSRWVSSAQYISSFVIFKPRFPYYNPYFRMTYGAITLAIYELTNRLPCASKQGREGREFNERGSLRKAKCKPRTRRGQTKSAREGKKNKNADVVRLMHTCQECTGRCDCNLQRDRNRLPTLTLSQASRAPRSLQIHHCGQRTSRPSSCLSLGMSLHLTLATQYNCCHVAALTRSRGSLQYGSALDVSGQPLSN